MDPVVVATGITTLLVPVVKKMTEAFAGEAGKAVFTRASDLLDRLKARFINQPVAIDVVRRFEKEPDLYRLMLKDVLAERLKAEPVLAAELSSYLTEIKKTGPHLHIVQQVEKAEELIGLELGRASSGNIRVEQQVGEAKKIIGAKIDEIK